MPGMQGGGAGAGPGLPARTRLQLALLVAGHPVLQGHGGRGSDGSGLQTWVHIPGHAAPHSCGCRGGSLAHHHILCVCGAAFRPAMAVHCASCGDPPGKCCQRRGHRPVGHGARVRHRCEAE